MQKAARDFVRRHGPSKAVAEPVGRAGVRVVLVGEDGALGDVLVPDAARAEALVTEVDGLEMSTWDTETVAAAKIGAAHRRRMGTRSW